MKVGNRQAPQQDRNPTPKGGVSAFRGPEKGASPGPVTDDLVPSIWQQQHPGTGHNQRSRIRGRPPVCAIRRPRGISRVSPARVARKYQVPRHPIVRESALDATGRFLKPPRQAAVQGATPSRTTFINWRFCPLNAFHRAAACSHSPSTPDSLHPPPHPRDSIARRLPSTRRRLTDGNRVPDRPSGD